MNGSNLPAKQQPIKVKVKVRDPEKCAMEKALKFAYHYGTGPKTLGEMLNKKG